MGRKKNSKRKSREFTASKKASPQLPPASVNENERSPSSLPAQHLLEGSRSSELTTTNEESNHSHLRSLPVVSLSDNGDAEKSITPRRTLESEGSNAKEGSSPDVSLTQAGSPVDRPVTSIPSTVASKSTTPSQSDGIASFPTGKSAGKASKTQIKPFRRMVRQLEKYLDTAEVTELAQLTEQTDVVLKVEDLKRPFHHLMAIWETKGIVTENDVDFLVELLEDLETYKALNLVKVYQELLAKGSTEVNMTDCSLPTESTKSIEVPNQRQRKGYVQSDGELRTSLRESEVLTTPSRISRQITHTREDYMLTVLQLLGIGQQVGNRLTILGSMTLDRIHLFEDTISPVNVVKCFLTRLISYDYRSIRLFKELIEPNLILSAVPSQHPNSNPSSVGSINTVRLSCRDIVYAILMHCDPFLKQEVLSKMSACQLAVPIILPDLSQKSLSLLLWGIQKISKAWQDPASSVVNEVNVTQYPFPVVAAVRFAQPVCSKSNILNKILGSVQGNDEHPYFCSQEQDVARSILSKGTIEAVWYLPSGRKSRKHTLETALCFLNLRGDALDLPKQVQFLCHYATVILLFVNKTDVQNMLVQLNEISRKSKVLLILSSNRTSDSRCTEDEYLIASIKQTGANVVDTSTLASVDVSEKICYQMKGLLKGGKPVLDNLNSAVSICEKIGIAVDTLHPLCSKAREAAVKILKNCRENPKQYKLKALPLQVNWQKWSQLDKDRSWKGAQGNVERDLARLHTAKGYERQQQCETGMSTEMRFLYDEMLHTSAEYRQFLMFWLQHYLNEVSLASLRPLLDDMQITRDKLRETAALITDVQRRLNVYSLPVRQKRSMEADVKQLKSEETKLQTDLTEKTKTFDTSSLGFEHFVREFGQIYECFHNPAQRNQRNARQTFDVKVLPEIAAEMLLSGYPMEIFDGDACHVPIKWVKGVLKAVRKKIGDASVYVISVIGIQSSGKSTLLNSMFGVRFAVSAGRCTRGVFMQLLPISDTLRKEIDCEYIVVIDTEGLKAPEKAITERKSEDNELATFALCLSDMTLINIGGQTVGEELSNILQISAHAFIRMKEVHLSSSCYLIQQFVADITAQYRNQSSTQSILQKLDQAVVTAAAAEGKEDQYRQFSDCFNIVNIDTKDDNVQYIPSLWRGSMSSPNHDYSETVLKLKSALMREIKKNTRSFTLLGFEKRVSSVWNAVKKEDFVFNFRNTVEIDQYNKFTQIFKRQQLRLTQGMLKWELEAKQQMRNTTAENIEARKGALLQELEQTLALEMDEVRTSTDETLQSREFESVRQHSTYFYRDLELVEKNILDTVKKMIRAETDLISNVKAKEYQILPQLKAELRKQVLPVAERLKNKFQADYSHLRKDEILLQTEKDVKATFEEEWSKCMNNIEFEHPTNTEEQIRSSIESDLCMCVQESFKNTNLSKEMKELINSQKLLGLCELIPNVKSANDIGFAYTQIGPCNPEITRQASHLCIIVERGCRHQDFEFSENFFESIRDILKCIVSNSCQGCRSMTNFLVTLSCKIMHSSNGARKYNLLRKIMKSRKLLETLKQDNISTEWKIKKHVITCLKRKESKNFISSIIKKFASWFIPDMFGFSVEDSDEKFQNQLRVIHHEVTKGSGKKWFSFEITSVFFNRVHELLSKHHLKDSTRRHFYSEACKFYIEEAIRSEMDALSGSISWTEVQTHLKIDSVNIIDQMKRFVDGFKDVLPSNAIGILTGLSAENIEKFSKMVTTGNTRHILDMCLMTELPSMESEKYNMVFSVVAQTFATFLARIKSGTTFSTNLLRETISYLHSDLMQHGELSQREQSVSIAHVCSWIFPICVAVQTTFEKENSVQYQLEKEKDKVYGEFKTLCDGTCLDHLAAKSFCLIIKASLKDCLKNRICTTLFERLSKAGDEIFCSRPRFLNAILEDVCEEENFENYIAFLSQHSSFLQTWTLKFIAKKCCEGTDQCIRIKDIVSHETEEILRETEESLESTVRLLKEDCQNEVSFEVWVEHFTEYFEETLNSSLNEDAITEMKMYALLSNYELFTAECKNIIRSFRKTSLFEDAELPNTRCVTSLKEWFECLPKKLHVLLAQGVQGCGTQCPFCKTLCDDTVKEHKVHFSNLHFPIGLRGWRIRSTKRLVCNTCTANVASNREYYDCGCKALTCEHPSKPYKAYKNDYPDWDINPISEYEPTMYWKWVLSRFNDEFAMYHNCQPATIPWGTVTKEDALNCVRNDNS
ncbi:uncharacterized protein [Apostichopus japonicus]|uniref:uncharacterized protein isoform X4 n=1 Tax=Stichopus japonicus TaxID=307972 RepID=UPI003AB34FC9